MEIWRFEKRIALSEKKATFIYVGGLVIHWTDLTVHSAAMTRNNLMYHLNFFRCMHWTCPNPWSLFLSAQDRLIMLIYFPPIFLTQIFLWHMPSKTNLYMNNRQSILHNVSVGSRLYVWVRSQMKNRGKEVQMSCRKKWFM